MHKWSKDQNILRVEYILYHRTLNLSVNGTFCSEIKKNFSASTLQQQKIKTEFFCLSRRIETDEKLIQENVLSLQIETEHQEHVSVEQK